MDLDRETLKQVLASEKALRAAAEREMAETRAALEELVREVAPEMVEALVRSAGPAAIRQMPAAVLSAQAGQAVRQVLRRARTVVQLGASPARAPASPAPAAIPPPDPAPTPSPAPVTAPATAPEPPPEVCSSGASETFQPAVDDALWPGWLKDWAADRNFANARTYLQVMGETGEALRSAVADETARRLRAGARSGTETRAFNNLLERGLVGVREARRGKIKAHLVYLTSDAEGNGADAYRLLFGREPAPQEALELLKRHSSASHVYLILEAQRILVRAGYTVERYPEPVPLDGERTYHTDLVAGYGGQPLYVEAERDTRKHPGERREKWGKVFAAGGGAVYVAVGTEREAKALLSEIEYWAGQLQCPVHLRLMITEPWVVQDAIPSGWGVWQEERRWD